MNLARRSLLKGAALSGLSGLALSASGVSLAAGLFRTPVEPALVLVSDSTVGAAFMLGAQTHNPALKFQHTDSGLEHIRQVSALLNSPQPQRIIGLLDDASATLIIDLARSAGAETQWLGQHGVDARGSRHQLLTAEGAAGCATRFGQELNQCGAGFALHEQRQGRQGMLMELSASAKRADAAAQWVASLGHVLAALGSPETRPMPQVGVQHLPLSGHFVSFSIETGRSQSA
ncbi:hypothetical protein [Pseudomonas sp.]|uniref:hypothetical protein n=1 Tax=Pseudomonas sp. TaxID=306 RepID=UPI0019FC599F|nr:hypothetical protein [Pseudomonas sp.]MBF0674284.1 hypothetical protein [Pseudomonas sp.]